MCSKSGTGYATLVPLGLVETVFFSSQTVHDVSEQTCIGQRLVSDVLYNLFSFTALR